MAQLTFVIQTPLTFGDEHKNLLKMLEKLQGNRLHQVARLVFIGPAAVLSVTPLYLERLLNMVDFSEYSEDVGDDADEVFAQFLPPEMRASYLEMENSYQDIEAEMVQFAIAEVEDMAAQQQAMAEMYCKVANKLHCEVLVHDLAALHYNITSVMLHENWKFISTNELMSILFPKSSNGEVEGVSAQSAQDERVVFYSYKGCCKNIGDLFAEQSSQSLIFPKKLNAPHKGKGVKGTKGSGADSQRAGATAQQAGAHGANGQVQKANGAEPDFTVFFSFPLYFVCEFDSAMAANTDKRAVNVDWANVWEEWWCVYYGLMLLYFARKAGLSVQACFSANLGEFMDEEAQEDLDDIKFPFQLRDRIKQVANSGVPFFFSGPKNFKTLLKKQLPFLQLSEVDFKQVRAMLRYKNMPMFVF